MIDTWINEGKEIFIFSGDPSADPGKVWIDLDYVSRLLYIDNNGTARSNTLEGVLAHELVHALTGKHDDGIGAGK
jgi:hypothetical protein